MTYHNTKFETTSQYDSGVKSYPNVSYVEQTDGIMLQESGDTVDPSLDFKVRFISTYGDVITIPCNSSTTLTNEELYEYNPRSNFNVKKIIFGNGLTDVPYDNVLYEPNQTNFKLQDNLKFVQFAPTVSGISGLYDEEHGNKASMIYNVRSLEELILPDTIKKIDANSLNWTMYNDRVSRKGVVRLPKGIKKIEKYALGFNYNASKILNVEDIEEIEEGGLQNYYGCAEDLYMPNLKKIGRFGLAYYGQSYRSIVGGGSFVVTSGLTEVGFWGCQRSCHKVENLDLSNFTSIGDGAFAECAFSSVTLPNEITEIPNSLCYGWGNLEAFEIPNTVTSIGENAFSESNLRSVVIPSGVTEIKNGAFRAYYLSSVTVLAETPPTMGSYIFDSLYAELHIYVPAASVDAYKAADGWSTYADKIEAIPSE